MSGMRLPLTLSTTGHAIVFALLVLLVAEPPLPQPAVERGIEVVLGQSLPEPQAAVAPKTVSQPADPPTIAGPAKRLSSPARPTIARYQKRSRILPASSPLALGAATGLRHIALLLATYRELPAERYIGSSAFLKLPTGS